MLNSWLFFRVEDIAGELDYLKAMYFMAENSDQSVNLSIQIHIDVFFVFILAMGIIFSTPISQYIRDKVSGAFDLAHVGPSASLAIRTTKYAGLFFLLYISLSFLIVNSYNPFIYFRF